MSHGATVSVNALLAQLFDVVLLWSASLFEAIANPMCCSLTLPPLFVCRCALTCQLSALTWLCLQGSPGLVQSLLLPCIAAALVDPVWAVRRWAGGVRR